MVYHLTLYILYLFILVSFSAAVILTLEDIEAGEEVTISYIDSDADLAERTEELRDYGFVCRCQKCAAERLAGELAGL